MSAARSRKKQTTARRPFWLVIAVMAVIAVFYWKPGGMPLATVDTLAPPADGEIRVCYLDVGQGDSILIQTKDNAVLIDAGEYGARKALLSYLREAGVETLDYVVATHPHSDHIGGLPVVIGQFTVNHILMPDVTHTSSSYENLLKAIEENEIPVTVPEPGETFKAGLIELATLAPQSGSYNNINNYSLVFRMVYGETAFIFTGDAEWESEQEILESGTDVRAQILKAGHHGSNTATSDAFLNAVKPSAVVISCGSGNSYGHPHAELLAALEERGISVYRTDLEGTVAMTTDGKVIKLYVNEGE